MRGSVCRESRVSLYRRVCVFGGGNVFVQKNLFFEERYIPVLSHDFCAPKDRFLPGFYPANVKIRASKP